MSKEQLQNTEYIIAGAGSGKTTELTKRIVKFFNDGYQPDQVVLTTFTELAASEFKEKVRTELQSNDMTDEANTLDTASIGTVHSVANSFLTRYWYKLGKGPRPEVVPEEDKISLRESSLNAILTEEDSESFQRLHKLFRFVGEFNKDNPDFWKKHLTDVIDKMEVYGIDDLDESRKYSASVIEALFNAEHSFDVENAKAILRTFANGIVSGTATDQKRREIAESLVNSEIFSFQELWTLSKRLGPTNNQLGDNPGLSEIIASANESLRSSNDFGKPIKDYVSRIFDLAVKWRDHYKQYKENLNVVDYNDMEQDFLRLLDLSNDDNELREDLKSRCKVILVDEFQDSSPVQVRIFMSLSKLAEQSVWVGDPKQSIYAFRGSDTELIDLVTDVFKKPNNENGLVMGEPLGTSYRSRKVLVEFSNTVFKRAFDLPEKHVALNPDRKDNESIEPLRHWHFEDGNKDKVADALGQRIHTLLNNNENVIDKELKKPRPMRSGDIAVLCRSNSAASSVAESLRKIGYNVGTSLVGEGLRETAEYRTVHALLRFMIDSSKPLPRAELMMLLENKTSKSVIENLLEWSRIEDQDSKENPLTELGTKEKWGDNTELIQRLQGLRTRLRGLPVPNLVESVITLTGLRDEVNRWGGGHYRRQNLDLVIKAAYSYDERCLRMGTGASVIGFLSYLDSMKATKTKPLRHPDVINVLTYHTSKGLEWPVVILTDLNHDALNEQSIIQKEFFGVSNMSVQGQNDNEIFKQHRIRVLPWFAGTRNSNLTEDMVETIKETPDFERIIEKQRQELKRLLYVGVTRARDVLITTSAGSSKKISDSRTKWLIRAGCPKDDPDKCETEIIDLFGTGIMSTFERVEAYDEEKAIIHKEEEYRGLKRSNKPSDNLLKFISPSSITFSKEETKGFGVKVLERWNRVAVDNDRAVSDSDFGDCLHHIICAVNPNDEDEESLLVIKRILGNHIQLHMYPEPIRILNSIRSMYAALEKQYGPAVSVGKEVPILHKQSNGQIVRGTIDLLWHTEPGTVVVDVKTYQGVEEDVTSTDKSNYAGKHGQQLNLYADVLKSAGYKVKATVVAYVVGGMLVSVEGFTELEIQ